MYALIEDITPAMAERFLIKNDNNRRLAPKVVDRYASIMKSGNWEENGEPICIAEDGSLKNGQHRLNAIIKANTTIRMLVVYDVKNDVHTYDRGDKRTIRHILQLNGYDPSVYNPTFVAGLSFLFFKALSRTPSDSEVMHMIDAFGDICTDVIHLISNGSDNPLGKSAGSAAAVIASLYFGTNGNIIENFFESLNTGFTDSKIQSSAIVARNYFLSHKEGTYEIRKNKYLVILFALQDYKNSIPRKKPYYCKTNKIDTAMMETIRGWFR